ncbi:SET domain-containing protein [Streptomyces sp. NPDC054961]
MHQETADTSAGVAVRPAPGRGLGVFALRDYAPGDTVLIGRPTERLDRRTDHSFQTGWDTHVELDAPARLVNHSCSPNTGLRDNAAGGYDFIALHPIEAGSEIAWDYASTEWESIAVPRCACGSAHCRGASRGFRHLTEDQVAAVRGFVADYLRTAPDRAATAETATAD